MLWLLLWLVMLMLMRMLLLLPTFSSASVFALLPHPRSAAVALPSLRRPALVAACRTAALQRPALVAACRIAALQGPARLHACHVHLTGWVVSSSFHLSAPCPADWLGRLSFIRFVRTLPY